MTLVAGPLAVDTPVGPTVVRVESTGEMERAVRAAVPVARIGEVAFHDVHVVEVVLEKQVRHVRVVHDVEGLVRGVEIEAGDIAGVDRLDQPGRAQRAKASVLKLEGTGWDIGHAVRFLLSNHARYITGSGIAVDGGASLG